MVRNRLHFGQAEGTPFTRSPLSDDFDWEASTVQAEALLCGNYSHMSDTPNCDDLLRECVTCTTSEEIPAEISMDEFKGKIRCWKESTTTSPSGRHLGRYKALFAEGQIDELEDVSGTTMSLPAKQAALASLIFGRKSSMS